MPPLTFESMDEAFSYCREVDRPVVVLVGNTQWKLYPSGKAEEQGAQRPQEV